MSTMGELLKQTSKHETDLNWISLIDLNSAYGQMKLALEASQYYNFTIMGETHNGYY